MKVILEIEYPNDKIFKADTLPIRIVDLNYGIYFDGKAKIVQAIPIEWIKKKSLEFLMNRNFRWATDFQEVIDMWKVENNIPLFDDELKITWEKENEID